MRSFLKTLFAVSTAVVLVACGSGEGTDDSSNGENGAAADGDPLDVTLIISGLGDLSFNDSAYAGIETAKEEYGDKINTKVIEYGLDASAIEPTLLDTVDTGADVVIVPTQFVDAVAEHAADYPEKSFWIYDAEFDYESGNYENVYSITYEANEASYLGGYALASTTETDKLGFIGGMENNIIADFLVGFVEGAREVNPDIKVATSYVGAWDDSARGKEQAIAMFNQDVSQIFNVAGASGVGIIEAAVEMDGLVLGVDADQAMMYKELGQENFANVITTSVLKNIGESLHRAIGLYLEGNLQTGATEYLGLAENGVGLAMNEYTEAFYSQEVIDEINAIREKIENGEIEVPSAYDMTVEEIDELITSIAP